MAVDTATAVTPPADQPTIAGRHTATPPQLCDGVELIGEYEGSGFRETPHIARRADGQVIQLTQLLHVVLEEIDGRRTYREIAAAVSARFGRRVSAGNVQFLVERKLRPLCLVTRVDGSAPKGKKLDPLLGLKFRTAIVPEGAVNALTTVFRGLFWAPVVILAIGAIAFLDTWVFFLHGVGPGIRTALYEPQTMLVLFGGVVVATAFHEIGHASACRYGGARPGAMGAGIYLVWPVFYCDVTDAYRLSKGGRLRTDLGGIYFNMLFAIACGGAFALTGWEPLLLLVLLQHMAIVQQLLPFLRLDGYYVLSDLTGVPDILGRIKPILRSLLPGVPADKRVRELKPWVRIVVSLYVVVLVPLLAGILVLAIISAPRIFATAWDSVRVQVDGVRAALDQGQAATVAAGVLKALLVVLPAAGLALMLGRFGGRSARGVAGWTKGRPARVAPVAIACAAAAGLAAWTWWPNGDYEPLRPGEKATLAGAVDAVREIPGGRPTFTIEQERSLGAAPAVDTKAPPAELESTQEQQAPAEPPGAQPAKPAPAAPQDPVPESESPTQTTPAQPEQEPPATTETTPTQPEQGPPPDAEQPAPAPQQPAAP